ncbi:septum formation family protein [Actinosynnema sp. NPDC020468]|uniref:septum formation family protein n=1 Tax=Actinosynnema sp. NPDC020468 TaxID=3154488 RepID=UPI0033F8B88E
MLGAFSGAFGLLLVSAFTSVVPAVVAPPGGGATTSTTVNPAYAAQPGNCLDWTKKDLADINQVDCAKQHLFEVTGVVDLGPRYPSGAPYPDDATWAKISEENCAKTSLDYLGGKFDPFGKYTVGPLNPGEGNWKEGQRTVRCGLQVAGPGGGLLRAFGTAKTQDQSDVYDPGVCLGVTDAKSVGDPIECSKPHTFEIVGVVALPAGDFPSPEKQDETMAAECARISTEYSGTADFKARNLIVTWDTRVAESWAAGSHKANCKVGAPPNDAGLVAWEGSVRNPDAPPLTTANPPQTTAVSQAEATGAPLHSSSAKPSSNAPSSTSGSSVAPTTTTVEPTR